MKNKNEKCVETIFDQFAKKYAELVDVPPFWLEIEVRLFDAYLQKRGYEIKKKK